MTHDYRQIRQNPKEVIDEILSLERDLDAYTDEDGDHLDEEEKAYLLPILVAKMDRTQILMHLYYIADQNERIEKALKKVNSNLTSLELYLT